MHNLQTIPGRTAIINNKTFLFFSGYDYLAIGTNEAFKQLVIEGIEKYGWLFPSSRISNTQLSLYKTFETQLALDFGFKNCVSFSSGFNAANAAVNLFKDDHEILASPFCHPALGVQAASHDSFEDWSDFVINTVHQTTNKKPAVIVTDAVNIFTAKIFCFDFLKEITQPVICIIDDSHGLQITGSKGLGIAEILPENKNVTYIICASLSKGLHINGGVVFCNDNNIIRRLQQQFYYTASTAISPALMYAYLHAKSIYSNAYDHLKINMQTVNAFYRPATALQLPIIILPASAGDEQMQAKNIIISSFNYPTPQSPRVNRAIINAAHTKNDINYLLETLNSIAL